MSRGEPAKAGSGVLYVVPTFPGESAAVDANWIASAELAEALGACLGGAEMLTPLGLASPLEVRTEAVRASDRPSAARRAFRSLPRWARLPAWEARDWHRSRRMREVARETLGHRYRLVVQLHSKYQDCGQIVARAIGAPFVLRVEAFEVREEAGWGVRRPLWGRAVERMGELRLFRRADLVAAVSEALDRQLGEAGIARSRRVVVRNGVNLDSFSPGEADAALRKSHGLEGRFVVGWIGGFRPFHGLEAIPAIARGLRVRVPGAVLCMVGTGPEREQVARRVDLMGDVVRFVGAVPHDEVSRWIRSFDACLLLAGSDAFHYSPLKLYEYLGCGRPVVAVDVGQVGQVIRDGQNGLLAPLGRPGAVVDRLERLAADPILRERLGQEARRTALEEGSWDRRAQTLIEALEDRGLLPAPSSVRGGSGGGGESNR